MPEPGLKPAPRLVPPTLTAPALPSARRPPTPAAKPTPASARCAASALDEGAIFLRADRIEGSADKSIEASGKVELRTRRETVLADWLRYDFVNDEIWGKGDVLIRYGFDWITGPEVRFKRGTETGFFASPRFFVAENNSRGSAAEIRFAGPDHYEASDARYTTCVAPREDWYLRMGELEVDKTRMVGTGRDATVYFFGAPVLYSPWFEFPLSNERKSGFLTPTTGLTGIRGFEYAQPYYLNLAPNYDATITPRLMTKRGIQFGGAGALPVRERAGRSGRRNPAGRSRHGHDPVAALVAAHPESRSNLCPASPATGITTRSPTTRTSPTCPTASVSRRRRRCRAKSGSPTPTGRGRCSARAQGFQTLQDPAAPPQPIPYNRVPQGARDAARARLERAHVRRRRRIRVLPAADADDGSARLCVADRRLGATGRGVVVHGAHRRAHAASTT